MTELLQLIEKAAKEGTTSLDFSNQGLTELPPELGQLTHLEGLDLSDNQLVGLPSQIGQLSNLTKLDISYNFWVTFLVVIH